MKWQSKRSINQVRSVKKPNFKGNTLKTTRLKITFYLDGQSLVFVGIHTVLRQNYVNWHLLEKWFCVVFQGYQQWSKLYATSLIWLRTLAPELDPECMSGIVYIATCCCFGYGLVFGRASAPAERFQKVVTVAGLKLLYSCTYSFIYIFLLYTHLHIYICTYINH